MEKIFLNQTQLARRWCISPRTLERWRWHGVGLPFYKVGGRVIYRLSDVEALEKESFRNSTSDQGDHSQPAGVVI